MDIKQFALEQPHDLFVRVACCERQLTQKLTETFVVKLQTSFLVAVSRGSLRVVVPQVYFCGMTI